MHKLLFLPFVLSACAYDATETASESAAIASGAEVLVSDAGQPRSLTAAGGFLYWIDDADHSLVRMPRTGGAITVLATGATTTQAWAIAVDATHVYWLDVDDRAVRKTPIAGGATRTLVTEPAGSELIAVAIDSTHVYFTSSTSDGGKVRRVSKTGTTATTIATGSFPSALATDGFFVYVADGHVLAGANQVFRVTRTGGAKIVLSSDEDTLGLAIDSSSVYWKRFWTGDIRKTSKYLPGATTIAPDGGGWGDIDVASSSVWWTTGPLLHQAPRTGGAGAVVFEATEWANSIDADGADVFLAIDAPFDPDGAIAGGMILRWPAVAP